MLVVVSVRAQEIGPGFVQLALNREIKILHFETYFGEDEQPYLNFNEFMDAVELPIRFDASLNHAAGFLANGITRFSLNLNRMSVEVGDEVFYGKIQGVADLEKETLLIMNESDVLMIVYKDDPDFEVVDDEQEQLEPEHLTTQEQKMEN